MSRSKADRVLRLRLPFACPIAEALVDELEVRYVLPEGGSFAKAAGSSGPYGSSVREETKVDYFDLAGRPVRIFT